MQSERKQNRPKMTTERETIWEVLTFKICLLILVVISAGEGGGKSTALPYELEMGFEENMTRPELMLLKFKAQRQPIIPAGSWDKNPIVQHTEIWCCWLLLISFYWKEKKRNREKDQQGNPKLLGSPARFQHRGSASGKETAGKLNSKNVGKTDIWK